MAEEEVIEIDMAQLKKMKVPELRAKLGEWGLETKGTKVELLARVDAYLKEDDEELLDEVEEVLTEPEEPAAEKPSLPVVLEEAKEEEKIPDKPVIEDPPAKSQSPIPVKPPVDTEALSEAEKHRRRGERFGVVSEQAKKQSRADRFGLTVEKKNYDSLGKTPTTVIGSRPPTEDELNRMKKRAERFGITPPCLAKVEEEDKKKKRMERFGLGVTEVSTDVRKKMRAERFGL